MIDNAEDAVISLCEIVFHFEKLPEKITDEIISFICDCNNDGDLSVLSNSNLRCDFNAILRKYQTALIAARTIKDNADAFRDDNYDSEWNNDFFKDFLHEIKKRDSNFKEENAYWIKDIIDCRFLTISNIGYITAYSISIAQKQYDRSFAKIQSDYHDLEAKINADKGTLKKLNKDLQSTQRGLERATESSANLIPNMLTALGIFVTIIVTIVAVYIANAFPNSGMEFSVPQMQYGRYVLSGQIIFNSIYLLLYFISKLTQKTLHVTRYRKNETNLIDKLSFIEASWLLSPLMWLINIMCVIAYTILVDWWVFSTYTFAQIKHLVGINAGNVNHWILWLSVSFILVITLIPLVFVYCMEKQTKKHLEQLKKK